jgi:hypothetical protein
MAKTHTQTTEVSTETKVPFDASSFIASCGSLSAAIRSLHADGKSRGEIAKMLSERGKLVRYQHVRNVLITPVKKTANAIG